MNAVQYLENQLTEQDRLELSFGAVTPRLFDKVFHGVVELIEICVMMKIFPKEDLKNMTAIAHEVSETYCGQLLNNVLNIKN